MVLKVEGRAQWSGPPGDCDDGLGQNDVPTQYYAGPTLVSESVSGVKYVVASVSGGHVSFQVSPSAHAYRSTCNVGTRVSLTPVTLTLSGPLTTASGGYECMIGRGVTGSLSAGGYTIDPGSYSWSIGGSRIKDYFADSSSGTVYPVDNQELHAQSPRWFWTEAASALVSCTAMIDLPDGTTPTVTAGTGCDIYSPDSQFGPNLLSDHWTMTTGDSGARTAVTWDISDTSEDAGFCIKFYGSAKTPDRFWEDGPGQHCYVQLAYIWDITNTPAGPILNNTNNTWELDNYFPYVLSDGASGLWPANIVMAGQLVARDGPGQALASTATSFNDTDTYRMYQLYHPTGYTEHTDWVWVPLNYIQWHCNASDSVPWTAFGSPIPGSHVQIDSTGATSNPPQWSDVFHNKASKIDSSRRLIASRKVKP